MWTEYITPEEIKIDKMYTLFEEDFPAGYTFSGETHDFWECMYVKSGEVCASGNERVHSLKAGEIIFHKPLELHKFTVETDCELFILSFDLSGTRASYFKNKVFRLTAAQEKTVAAFLDFLHGEYFRNRQTSDYLARCAENPLKFQMAAGYFTQLLLSLCENCTPLPVSDSFDAEIFQTAVSHMNARLSAGLTVRQIAAECHVSETVLKTVFAKYGGMGVHKYFLALKISHAARALKKGMSVTAAADAYGFKSQSYFSAAFRRETGMSPSEYAKKG